jgi:hypothetical protein
MTVGQKTRKPLTSKGFSYLFLWMIIVDYRLLFADTKFAKYIPEHFLIIDMAGDGAEG